MLLFITELKNPRQGDSIVIHALILVEISILGIGNSWRWKKLSNVKKCQGRNWSSLPTSPSNWYYNMHFVFPPPFLTILRNSIFTYCGSMSKNTFFLLICFLVYLITKTSLLCFSNKREAHVFEILYLWVKPAHS